MDTDQQKKTGGQDKNGEDKNKNQQAQAPAPHKSRINMVNAIFLILVALIIDGVQIFLDFIIIGLVVNYIIDIYAWLIFFVWLKLLGISMFNAKGTRTMIFLGVALGIELIPFINALPGWTVFAVLTVINDRSQGLLK